jgi:anti-anti-sigma factor
MELQLFITVPCVAEECRRDGMGRILSAAWIAVTAFQMRSIIRSRIVFSMAAKPRVFDTETIGNTLIVIPHGDGLGFRYVDVQIEANQIRRTIAEPGVNHLVIDLAELEYFGSEVIGVFITMAREATNRGGKAAMCNASEKMRQVLESMKLFKLGPHCDSRKEALEIVEPGIG